jgi:hypothetical protein
MLDLEHRPLAGHVRLRLRFGDDAIEPGAFEPSKPFDGNLPIACHRRQVDGRLRFPEQTFECAPAVALRFRQNRRAIRGQRVKCDE